MPSKLPAYHRLYTAVLQAFRRLRPLVLSAVRHAPRTLFTLSIAGVLLANSPAIRHLTPIGVDAWINGGTFSVGFDTSNSYIYEASARRCRELTADPPTDIAPDLTADEPLALIRPFADEPLALNHPFFVSLQSGACQVSVGWGDFHWLDLAALVAATLSPLIATRLHEAGLAARDAFTDQLMLFLNEHAAGSLLHPLAARLSKLVRIPTTTFLWVLVGSPELQTWPGKLRF